jgi:hypothetical protein
MAMTGTKKLHLKNRLSGLAVMVTRDLPTDSELAVLTGEALDAIRYAARQPYDIEWVDIPSSQTWTVRCWRGK